MVASQEEEVLGVLDLVREEKADGLERLLAAVDVVAQEQVVRLWWEAAVLEQAQQVVVLTVDVACTHTHTTHVYIHITYTYTSTYTSIFHIPYGRVHT